MNNADINENDYVKGFDIQGNPIVQGQVTKILKTLQVAIIRTGDDRLCTVEAEMKDIEKIDLI